MPLKDKLRLECVSKQFQRTVLQKHTAIVLEVEYEKCPEEYYPKYKSYKPNLLRLKYPLEYQVRPTDPQLEFIAFKSCHYKPIESLLKRCPNIQSINLWGFHKHNNQISKLMLQMITKYCNHLIRFEVFRFDLNECETQEFCHKFGPKLNYFGSENHVFDFNLFPNIETIDEYEMAERVEELLQLKSNNLKNLIVIIDLNKEHLLPQVMQKFQKLTHLTLGLSTNAVNKAFKDFPIHQNLKALHLMNYFRDKEFEGMCDSLKQIAIKCPKLKKIKLFPDFLKNISEVTQLFQLLKAFPALKRLNIGFSSETEFTLDINQWFSFELFKELPKITHLSLNLNRKPINESILKDIDIYLPKLQYLQIKSYFLTEPKGMTQMADILSRLSSLQKIKLRFGPEIDYQPMEDMIIEKCLKIKKIIFKNFGIKYGTRF